MVVLVFFVALGWICITAGSTDNAYKSCSDSKLQVQDTTVEFLKLKDAYKVTWAHAVNSPSKLNQALSSDIMILEADVQMKNNRTDTEPIMAHPPNTDSNLTLADFIDKVSKSEKGIKLDFKSLISVEPSLQLLKNISMKNPIWLNADILMGPCYDKVCTPVDATQFIALCQKYFPSSVLSLGWTTGNDMKPEKNMYTWKHVIEMAKLVFVIPQPVTFPVRASLIKRSLEQLLWLLDISRNLTLTVWSTEKDAVNAKDLVELRKSVYDKKNVYYDLPQSQADDFAKALVGVNVQTNNPFIDIIELKAYAGQACSDVLVGETKVLFTSEGGWVSTTKEMKARPDSLETKHLDIEVFFLSFGNHDIQQNITLVLGSNGLVQSTGKVKTGDGVQLTLDRNGRMTLTKNDGTSTMSVGVSDPNFQYHLSLWYGPNMDTIMFMLRSKADFQKEASMKYEGDYQPEKFFVLIGAENQQGAILVNKFSSAISLPSGSGSTTAQVNHALIIAAVSILVALSAILINL